MPALDAVLFLNPRNSQIDVVQSVGRIMRLAEGKKYGYIVLPIAEEKRLELRWVGPRHDRRLGHPGALNRVLLNLTTNALKFTAEGFVELKVTEISNDLVECSVRDSGRGVPAAAMPTLFEPFRRRQQEGDYAFSGSGLGLSICRKLVEGMGAELSVTTAQGEGTLFSFRLRLPMVTSEESVFA